MEFVYASDHMEALSELALARRQVSAQEALLRRLACTNPHDNAWERSYRAMQQQARSIMEAFGNEMRGRPAP